MSELSNKLFGKVNFGDKIPTGALLAGKTSSDGVLYVGRNAYGEIGKYNVANGTVYNLWCHGTGKTTSGNEILVIPPLATHKWVAYRKGNPLPPNALYAGQSGADGALFIGRAKNS
jgi:hypothetical protein